MIRIRIAEGTLLAQIKAKQPRWQAKAKRLLTAALRAGKLGKKDGIWSEIKDIFILLQHHKCIYCESPLPVVDSKSADKVAVDYDVEHYRPKNRVTPWPAAEDLGRRPELARYAASVKAGSPAGYLRLALDPFNYLVSCKVCNSSYKADRFPIAGVPDSRSKRRLTLDARERPLLLFPLGNRSDDPAAYLDFSGPVIRPRPQLGYDRLRAEVVIDFFDLDTRDGLILGRCLMIFMLWAFLEQQRSSDPQEREEAEAFLHSVRQEHRKPHTACGRAFIELFERDRSQAEQLFKEARHYLASKDPVIFRALSSSP